MARTENDTLGSGIERRGDGHHGGGGARDGHDCRQPLINDPFAEPLVRAVGVDFFTRLVTGELRPEDLDSDSESVGMQRMTDNMAVRTKFFDEFFLTATAGGHPASGDPRVGPGFARVPAGVARRDDGV